MSLHASIPIPDPQHDRILQEAAAAVPVEPNKKASDGPQGEKAFVGDGVSDGCVHV